MGKKLAANPVTGAGSTTVPVATTPSRSAVAAQFSLCYDSGAQNGTFSFGRNLSFLIITRRNNKARPQYHHDDKSELLPFMVDDRGRWTLETTRSSSVWRHKSCHAAHFSHTYQR
jgi:hypothetical protein